MLHPSYTDLMKVVNSDVATAKRARQIIAGDEPLVTAKVDKPLSIAVEELNQGKIKILGDDEEA